MIEQLQRLLAGMGYEVGSPELLDVLWLARVVSGTEADRNAAVPSSTGLSRRHPEPITNASTTPAAEPPVPAADSTASPTSTSNRQEPPHRHGLFTAESGTEASEGRSGIRARAIRAPRPRTLPRAPGLAQALRPLRGHREHRYRTVVDIDATVRLSAESGMLNVVDRPAEELQRTAVLLVDDSPSMQIWLPLVGEIRHLLERCGSFRAVHVHRLDVRSRHRPPVTPATESPVTLLLTDGVDDEWRKPTTHRFLAAWARSGPMAVLSPLPRRLWRGTAFDAQPQLLTAAQPFPLAHQLDVLDPLGGAPTERPLDGLPVPAFTLSPASLATWSRLLNRPGTPAVLDTTWVATLPSSPGADVGDKPGEGPESAQRLVDRFRSSHSRDAYRLAVRLSAIRPLSLPVIQLVRGATLPDSTSTVVAEVLLGSLLDPLREDGPGSRQLMSLNTGRSEALYDFKPGIRDLLSSGLNTEQSIAVVDAVGEALEPYLGRMPNFAALMADPTGIDHISPGASAFATLMSPVLDRFFESLGPFQKVVPEVSTEFPAAPARVRRFTVFGSQLVWDGNEPVWIGSPQQRALLVALLLRKGHVVDEDALVEAVWGGTPPASAVGRLRLSVSRLRHVLSPAEVVIDDVSGGYRFTEPPGGLRLDLTTAELMAEEAAERGSSGDLRRARELLQAALLHVDGRPLDGVPGPYADNERSRLSEWRLALLVRRIELDLDLGASSELISELNALTAAHPLNERLRSLLMVALYHAGRPTEALAVHADTRRLLAAQFGVEPSRELSMLHQRILEGATDLVRVTTAPETPRPPSVTAAPLVAESDVRFSVLGPVRAWRGGEALPSGSPQQRALLATLLLRGGRTATAPELIDAIWGEDPPPQALATIRTYASRLRKILDPGLLVAVAGGYAIRTTAAILDLQVAQGLSAEAETARAAGNLTRAHALLNDALALWNGEPLAGVPGPHADTERTRLQEWRLQLLETRLDLDLEVGHHAEAVSELTALTAAHPLRERLRELLMLALYRSGRQAEALAVYADTRRLLADELGVDPRPELSVLQQRILRADAELARAEDPAPAAATVHVRPAQLPATVPDFTGRSSFVDELGAILSGGAQDQVMAVSALAGIGGVGKTTLAVHVAHAARPHFPDGQLYVDLQGIEPYPAEPVAVLGSFLRALGTPDTAIPDSPADRAALYRSTLDGRRVLVLLDNARDAAQVRPLLPGTAGCAALVTSRVRMAGLAGAHLVDLDVMSPEEALQLFTRIVGEERVRAERQAALDVVGACGFLPLAIRIAASRLAARRTWTVSVLAAKLADERRRLDELQAGDLAVKATFELGYGQLEPAQQRAFRLLGLADGPDISLSAAAAVLDLPEYDTEDLLEALVDCSLLESAAPGRYRFHDLVRLYARACADRDEQPPSGREAALDRLLDFYLATASGVYALERPGDLLPAHLSDTHYPGLRFTEPRAALDWLYTEANPLLASARHAATRPAGPTGLVGRAVDLLWAAKDLAESGANSNQYEHAARALRDAARQIGDAHAEGRARTTLTNVHLVAGRFDEADEEARQAMDLAREAGDPLTSCWAPNDRGIIALYQNRFEDGERYLLEAIENFRADGNDIGEASALCNLSRIHVELGRLTSAIDLAEQGIAIYERMGLTLRLANGRYALGIALTEAGRLGEAQTQLTEALSLFHDNGQPLWEGVTHFRLAVAHLAAHRPTLAAAHAEQAIALRGIGGEWRRATVLTVLGKALRRLGQRDRARVCWRDAESIFAQLGSAELAEVQALLASETAA